MSFSVKPLLFIKGVVIVTVLAAGQAAQAQSVTSECDPFVNGEIQPQFSCSDLQTKRVRRPTRPQPPGVAQKKDWRMAVFDNATSSGAGSDGGAGGSGGEGGNGR